MAKERYEPGPVGVDDEPSFWVCTECGPDNLVQPRYREFHDQWHDDQAKAPEREATRQSARGKLKKLGLTDEEIDALAGGLRGA